MLLPRINVCIYVSLPFSLSKRKWEKMSLGEYFFKKSPGWLSSAVCQGQSVCSEGFIAGECRGERGLRSPCVHLELKMPGRWEELRLVEGPRVFSQAPCILPVFPTV